MAHDMLCVTFNLPCKLSRSAHYDSYRSENINKRSDFELWFQRNLKDERTITQIKNIHDIPVMLDVLAHDADYFISVVL